MLCRRRDDPQRRYVQLDDSAGRIRVAIRFPTRRVKRRQKVDEALDELLYRPEIVKAFVWIPRWWRCDMAKRLTGEIPADYALPHFRSFRFWNLHNSQLWRVERSQSVALAVGLITQRVGRSLVSPATKYGRFSRLFAYARAADEHVWSAASAFVGQFVRTYQPVCMQHVQGGVGRKRPARCFSQTTLGGAERRICMPSACLCSCPTQTGSGLGGVISSSAQMTTGR